MGDIGGLIAGLLITLVILFVIFLIMRELMCWYWKINEAISLLKSIDDKLNKASTTSSDTIKTTISGPDSILSAGKDIVKIGAHNFISIKGEPGEAFCTRCRTTSSKSEMLYCKEIGIYYHESCVPK